MNIVYAAKILATFLLLAAACSLITRRAATDWIPADRWRQGWIGLLGTVALACLGWKSLIFLILLGAWAAWLSKRPALGQHGRLPAYVLVLTVSPVIFIELRDLGPIEYLLRLDVFRVLALVLLLPEAFRLAQRPADPTPGWVRTADLCMGIYSAMMLNRLTGGGHGSFSVIGREVLQFTLDFILPYFVFSRGLREPEVRTATLQWLLLGALYQATIAVFETLSHHQLYIQFQWLYGDGFFMSQLMRGDWLRAQGSSGPLALGVLMIIAAGIWQLQRQAVPKQSTRHRVVLLLLLGALVCTYGRGPWLAMAMLFLSLGFLRVAGIRQYLSLSLLCAVALAVAWTSGLDSELTKLLAFGPASDRTADFNVAYRQELLNTAIALIVQSPWWGVDNYLAYMEHLRQGEGIIDLVNTYVIVALNTGLVGTGLFLMPWLIGLGRLSSVRDPASLGTAKILSALSVSVLAVITTVSPVNLVQPMMLMVLGLSFGLTWRQPVEVRREGAR